MRTILLMLSVPLLLGVQMASAQETSDTTTHKGQLGVVGTAHLDTQWRWTIQNTINEFVPATLRDNFRLLDEYPDYIFSFEGAFRYMLAKEYYPDDYARLKDYIAKGRWRVTGSWVDAVDVNIPSFESIVRQTLYGNGYFKKEFGKSSRDIFLPDCFGFGYALPSIAAHCGLKSFSTQKLSWGCSVPVPFDIGLWEGVDGSTIIAGIRPGDYVAKITGDLTRDTLWEGRVEHQQETSGLPAAYMYFGTGDTGGAPESLSVDWLQKSIKNSGPLEVHSIGADDLVDMVAQYPNAKLPRFKGELLMTRHGVGCYTSEAAMKRWNRKNELLADAAERAAVTASLLGGYEYPRETFRDTWTRFLWHQFHDDLTGTSLPEAYEFSWSDELLCLNRFSGLLTGALESVAPALDTRAKGQAVVVYNPLAMNRQDVVEVTIPPFPASANAVAAYGPDSKAVPAQVLSTDANGIRIAFLAEVPSVGFAVYDVRGVKAASATAIPVTATTTGLENARYKITLNAQGDVASIYDKNIQKELLAAPISWQLIFDKPHQWPAWEIQYEDLTVEPKDAVGGTPAIRVLESGPVRGAIEITRTHGNSTFKTIVRLASGSAGDRVEFVNAVDWQEKETLLKAAFQLNSANDSVTYDLGLGVIERGTNTAKKYEVPGHQWADMASKDGTFGVAILNDCKYGWDHPDDKTLRLSLIHTPGVFENWSWVGDQSTQDIGRHTFTYAVVGHQGDWRGSNVAWQAARLNQPLVAGLASQMHAGRLGKSHSLVAIETGDGEPGQVMINALKKAEDSDEFIIRLKELHGRPAAHVEVRFANAILSAREVNGQEEEIGPATVTKGVLETSLTPFQPRAFAVKLFHPTKDLVQKAISHPINLTYDLDGISTDAARTDGNFDGQGNTLAGELLPEELTYDGAQFTFGSKTSGAKNVLSCTGQSLDLPKGLSRRLYLLMTSVGGPSVDKIVVRSAKAEREIPVSLYDYAERIGQWDNRMVNGQTVSEASEIAPAFINHMPVAWYGGHRHTADGKNDTYRFTYLFAVRVDLARTDISATLPNNPRIKLLAATVTENAGDPLAFTTPLYDAAEAPLARIEAEQTAFTDSTIVRLSSPTPGATVHYTVDGSVPNSASQAYAGPLTLTNSATIKAVAFTGDNQTSHVSSIKVTKLVPRPGDQLTGAVPGLRCQYYEGSWGKLPKFDSLFAVKEAVVDTVAIPSFARPEDYGLVMTGYIQVPHDGMYVFGINSDDGSALWVGDTLVVDNDGIHGDGEVTGKVALLAGFHPLAVRMFQAKGGQALSLSVQGPDMPKQPVQAAMLFHIPPKKLPKS